MNSIGRVHFPQSTDEESNRATAHTDKKDRSAVRWCCLVGHIAAGVSRQALVGRTTLLPSDPTDIGSDIRSNWWALWDAHQYRTQYRMRYCMRYCMQYQIQYPILHLISEAAHLPGIGAPLCAEPRQIGLGGLYHLFNSQSVLRWRG